MTSEKQLREVCLELMRLAHPAYLTTVDVNGYPQTRAVFNLRNTKMWPGLASIFDAHNNDFMVLFSTNTSSLKMNDLKTNLHVSVYYCDPENWRGMMLGGNIEIVKNASLKKEIWQDGWERYYLQGYDDPDYTVLRLYPAVAKGWNQSCTFRIDLK